MINMDKIDNELLKKITKALSNVKEKTPLTDCITNYVTVNDCANAILAIGGSPIMGDDPREIEDFVEIVDALVINMGAVTNSQIEAIEIGSKYAKKTNKPIVLDPVGVGVSKIRNNIILELINESKLSVIRGNMSEIKFIARLVNLDEIKSSNKSESRGVDVSEDDEIRRENLETNEKIVSSLASKINTVIIASGAIDIISDGKSTYCCENGDPIMTKITGSGCMLSSIVGSFCGANEALIAGLSAAIAMGIAGEEAGKIIKKENSGTGTFRVKLIDYLYKIDEELLKKEANVYKINFD